MKVSCTSCALPDRCALGLARRLECTRYLSFESTSVIFARTCSACRGSSRASCKAVYKPPKPPPIMHTRVPVPVTDSDLCGVLVSLCALPMRMSAHKHHADRSEIHACANTATVARQDDNTRSTCVLGHLAVHLGVVRVFGALARNAGDWLEKGNPVARPGNRCMLGHSCAGAKPCTARAVHRSTARRVARH